MITKRIKNDKIRMTLSEVILERILSIFNIKVTFDRVYYKEKCGDFDSDPSLGGEWFTWIDEYIETTKTYSILKRKRR